MRGPARTLLFWLVASGVSGCSATRSVRPVGAGHLGLSASLGGPLLTNLGPPIPLPIPVVSARLGVTDRTEIDVGAILPLVELVGFDVGMAHLLVTPRKLRPALMVNGRVVLVGPTGRDKPWSRPWAEAQITASWALARPVLVYVGATALALTQDLNVAPSVLAGLAYQTPGKGWQMSLEGRWLDMTQRSDDVTIGYVAPGSHGALGVVLAVGYTFALRRGAP